jgi:ubiquinone/menaquinone biosynthesis C-methylase UbiE
MDVGPSDRSAFGAEMKHGDFTNLAQHYIHRPGYSLTLLNVLKSFIERNVGDLHVADVGAGTGKLTNDLLHLGISVSAVEPNDAMLEQGKYDCKDASKVVWVKGSAEHTQLPGSSFNWVLMGSSFHWTDKTLALKEFNRILVPGGFFTALWNPRDLSDDILQKRIENKIHQMVPGIRRISSGSSEHMHGIEEVLLSTGHFHNLFFIEGGHSVMMDKDRYIGVWRSVNDIQVQAGEEKFREIVQMIESEICGVSVLEMKYKTRAWTIQKKENTV